MKTNLYPKGFVFFYEKFMTVRRNKIMFSTTIYL